MKLYMIVSTDTKTLHTDNSECRGVTAINFVWLKLGLGIREVRVKFS